MDDGARKYGREYRRRYAVRHSHKVPKAVGIVSEELLGQPVSTEGIDADDSTDDCLGDGGSRVPGGNGEPPLLGVHYVYQVELDEDMHNGIVYGACSMADPMKRAHVQRDIPDDAYRWIAGNIKELPGNKCR